MHKYRLISKKGEGTFSEVLKAQSIKSNKYLAIKCMKNHFDSIDQVNNLREIQALRRLSPHPGIIKLYEVLYDQPTGRLALVFELMDMNIYEMIRGRRHYLPEPRVKQYMYQLLKSMDHMHRNGIFHRDIKPENILVSDDVLKVADFGSCRGIYSKQPYTEYISTRWYRAPECLLTDGYYGYKMDLWGVGCVMFEVIALFPLFPGTNELDQIERIHNIVGTPPKKVLNKFKKYATHIEFNFAEKVGSGIAKLIPHADETCIDLIVKMLAYDPEDRLSARQALRHPYFGELRQADKQREKAAKLEQSKGRSEHGAAGGHKSHSEQQAGVTGTRKKPTKGGNNNKALPDLQSTNPNSTSRKDASGVALPAISANITSNGKSNGGSHAKKHMGAAQSKSQLSHNASSFHKPTFGGSSNNSNNNNHFSGGSSNNSSNNKSSSSNSSAHHHLHQGPSTKSSAMKGSTMGIHDSIYTGSKQKGPYKSGQHGISSKKRYNGVGPSIGAGKKSGYPTRKGHGGTKSYYESGHGKSATSDQSYKSSYQSPYSQKYIARQRVVN